MHWCAIGRGPPGSAPRRAVAPPLLVRTPQQSQGFFAGRPFSAPHKLRLARDGTVRVVASSAPVDLLRGGERTLEPPFTLSLEVGDDAGTVAVPCRLGPSGGRCV